MTKAFYSFHFNNDVVRVGQVRNMGAVEGDQIIDDNSWEKVKKEGRSAIEGWINRQMASCDVVIVLVGEETASRPWVDYEVRRAWDTGKPVFGIRIHGLKNFQGRTSRAGANPFEAISMEGGGKLSTYVPLYDPTGMTSQDTYAYISENIKGWIKKAPRRKI
jgi:hypothetical protein